MLMLITCVLSDARAAIECHVHALCVAAARTVAAFEPVTTPAFDDPADEPATTSSRACFPGGQWCLS